MKSSLMSDPNLNRLIDNRYQLIEMVGKGAMGQVYRAQDTLLGGGSVAVKFLSQALLNKKMRDRFEREATTCALLGQKSIHIVRVTDYGICSNEVPYYVMEFLRGESLSELISPNPLPVPRFLNIARQICLGLECAHAGIEKEGKTIPIIHRDIKPSNILVCQDPTLGELVKILDFGIAKLLQEDGGQTNCFMGTLAYASPEQMEGKELDNRSDIYSLGVMMFQMLTGHLPLQAETHTFGGWYKAHHTQPPRKFASVAPDLKLPKALENAIMRCLAKEPKDRPSRAREVLEILEPLEERFKHSRKIGHRINEVLRDVPVITTPTHTELPSAEEVCRTQSWPVDKPLAQIVFPQVLSAHRESLPTLWVMLSEQEILQRQSNPLYSKLYKNFLCSLSPHPMVLWMTVLYNRELGPRWLRCYLDLKTPKGQEVVRLIGKKGCYWVLMFPLENPRQCAQVITVRIGSNQCRLLEDWANSSQIIPPTQPNFSKNLLKQEFEKLQPQILSKLESDLGDSLPPHLTNGR